MILLLGTLLLYPRIRYAFFPKNAARQIQESVTARDYWMVRDLTTYGHSTFINDLSTHYSSPLISGNDMIVAPEVAATMAGNLVRLYDNKDALRANGYYYENRTTANLVWLSIMTWR